MQHASRTAAAHQQMGTRPYRHHAPSARSQQLPSSTTRHRCPPPPAAAKQQPNSSSKDTPDMGARSTRRAKIPVPFPDSPPPQNPITSQDADTSSDPDSPGFQERALLMGFLDSLEPGEQQQFVQYMDSQLQGMQQEQQQQSALDYMQRVMHEAGRAGGEDPGQYIDSEAGSAALWESLRGQFSPSEVSLLDDVLGRDWKSFGSRAMQPDSLAKIARLAPEQQAMMADILSKVSDMTGQMDSLANDVLNDAPPSAATSSSSSSSPSSSSSSSSSSSRKSSWGSSFRQKKADRVSSSSSRGARTGAAAGSSKSAQQYWDTLLNEEMTGKVQKMMALAGQAAKGQLQWGLPPSRHLTTLKEIYRQMVQLETAQMQQPGALSPEQVGAAYAAISYQLNELVLQADASSDTATRSALLYMDALFNSSEDGDSSAASSSDGSSSSSSSSDGGAGQQAAAAASSSSGNSTPDVAKSSSSSSSGAGAADDAVSPAELTARVSAAAAAAVDSSGQSQSDAEASQGQARGGVTLQRLQQLGQFLAAAENLEAFQTWVSVFAEKHPHMASEEMLWFANLGGDDWFVRPELQNQALAAAQAAAEAWQAAEAAAAAAAAAESGTSTTTASSTSSSSRSRSSRSSGQPSDVSSAISGALKPFIDESRIEALAVLDADTLWFLAELEANSFSEDVLLKWSLHPSVGPKLMSGKWLSELDMSEPLRKLYRQAQVPDFMAGLNFDLKES